LRVIVIIDPDPATSNRLRNTYIDDELRYDLSKAGNPFRKKRVLFPALKEAGSFPEPFNPEIKLLKAKLGSTYSAWARDSFEKR
jgi:hypothetical protein